MDGASPEGTSIRTTEVSSQGSSVQGKLTGFAEQNAEAEGFRASSQSPIPDRSQDPRSKAATLQLPAQSNEALTDLEEFRGKFILRSSKKQVIPE